MDLEQQIQQMRQQLAPDRGTDVIDLITKVAPEIEFKRDYLAGTIDSDEIAAARHLIQEDANLRKEFGNMKALREDQERALSEKAPLLLGKKKHEQSMRHHRQERDNAVERIRTIEATLADRKDEIGAATELLGRHSDESAAIEKQFAADELVLAQTKHEIVEVLAQDALSVPPKLATRSWEEIQDWYKELLRNDRT